MNDENEREESHLTEEADQTEQAEKLGGTPMQAEARVETFSQEPPPEGDSEKAPRDFADQGERTEEAEFVQVEDDADLGVRETENRG
jgi:hypothetical protein